MRPEPEREPMPLPRLISMIGRPSTSCREADEKPDRKTSRPKKRSLNEAAHKLRH